MDRTEAEDFLFHEAVLLDERRFDEWLTLFTEDGLYWLPIEENCDPNAKVSLIYDDKLRRDERVFRMQHPSAHSQNPPSRTNHLIGNVLVENGEKDEWRIFSTQVISEIRREQGDYRQFGLGEQRTFSGRCEHRLRQQGDVWRIVLKKLVLLNRDVPIGNLTFIL